jgi:hypothetical protein
MLWHKKAQVHFDKGIKKTHGIERSISKIEAGRKTIHTFVAAPKHLKPKVKQSKTIQ